MIMDKFAVEEFVKYTVPNVWLFGNKGGKKEFVENFSCIRREDVINFGLFNERMDAYGGLSERLKTDLRHRVTRLNI